MRQLHIIPNGPVLILSVVVCLLHGQAINQVDGASQCEASVAQSDGPSRVSLIQLTRSDTVFGHVEEAASELRGVNSAARGIAGQGRPTVVVTGAAGFIGSHGVLALLAHGYRVVGVDNFSRGYSETIKTLEREAKSPRYSHSGGFKFYEVDLGQGSAFADVLRSEKPVAVLHFAGVAYAGESAVKPFRYYMNNTFNTMRVAEAMEEAGVKNLVYSSSCSTYGSPTDMPVTEETPQLPVSAYGRSKLQAEAMLKDWEKSVNADGASTPTQVVLMRYFNVIGADPEGRVGERRPVWLDSKSSDYKLYVRLSTALFDAAEGLLPKFTIAGDRYDTPDGTAQRDYVHVRDVVDAHVAVLHSMLHGGAEGKKLPNLRFYNVGTGKAYSVREMVDAAKRVAGVDFKVSIGEGRSTDPPAVWADPGKLLREVGWRPQYLNLTETLSHEWHFRQSIGQGIGKDKPSMLEGEEARTRIANTDVVDESGMSVTQLRPGSSKDVDQGDEGGIAATDSVATGPGIPAAFEKLLSTKYGGTGAGADAELGAAKAVEALEKECGGWDADSSQPKNPKCMDAIFKPLEQAKLQVNRSMMVREMDLVIPTIRNLDFLEDWREFIEGMHVIVVQDGDPDVKLAIPSWVDYELYNRRDINRSLGEKAWAISSKDSSCRIFGFLASKKPYVFTLDDDVFPGRKPNGQKINAPLMHYRNLKTASTPYYFNTLYDPFAAGADYVRGYPFSLRAGVPTAISHGLWLNTPDYDAPTQLLKPHERNERYAPATMTVPHGTIYSMCGMNMAFNRQLIGPAFMFGLMGEGQPWGRYDDMWAGWASKVCADRLGVGVKTGEPYVNHSKASNPFVNLKKEYRGLFWQEKIVQFFRDVKLSDDAARGPTECYNELSGLVSKELGHLHPYFHRLSEAMRIWTSAWRAAETGKISFQPSRSSSSATAGAYVQKSLRRRCNSKAKLVVNSHVKYAGKVLPRLLASLEKAHFNRWRDVVVFLGGAEQNSKPWKSSAWPGLTLVNLTLNAFDYNGFSGLYHYRNWPSICADSYLYVPDTVEFDETFPRAFDGLAKTLPPGDVLMSPRPNANIMAFTQGVVDKYGTNYDRNVSKQEAVWFEAGPIPGMQVLENFADRVHMTVDRRFVGMEDPYGTGQLHHKFFYPDLGIYKYTLWGEFDDIGATTEHPLQQTFPR